MNPNLEPKNGVKERILSVARALFIEHGYSATSVRSIAMASETNVALIHYYFESKYNLFEIVFEEAFDVLVQRLFLVFHSPLSFPALIEAWVNSYYEVLVEYPQIPIFILNEISQNPEQLARRIQRYKPDELFVQIEVRIQQEINRGTIRSVPPLDLALTVLSMSVFPFMFGEFATRVAGRTREEYNVVLMQHKQQVVQFILHALQP